MILALWTAFRALPRGWHYLTAFLAAIALLGTLWAYLSARENADDKHNQELGADRQQAETMAETLDQLEKADAAEEKLDRDPAVRRAGCGLHSRTPENCRP